MNVKILLSAAEIKRLNQQHTYLAAQVQVRKLEPAPAVELKCKINVARRITEVLKVKVVK